MKRTFLQASRSVDERAQWYIKHVDPEATYEQAVKIELERDPELAKQYMGVTKNG